jgi:ABC-type polar amino acid transport system ATPase subunit
VSLSIRAGEITALIGPSGAGKTTLLKTLSMLDPPDEGHLFIDKTAYHFPLTKGQKLAPPWPKLTVVFQQLFLWPHLTLRQNITLPLGNRLDQSTQLHLEQLIERFNMHEFINRYPNQASLGQRQRAALVRAIVLKPQYILLDEITSSLDVEQVASILSELRIMRDQGIGILLVTHLLQFAREAADSVVFIDRGKVIESGGKDLLASPREQRVRDFIAMARLAS